MPGTSSSATADLVARVFAEPPRRTIPELAAFLEAIPKWLRMEQALANRFLTHDEGVAATALAMHYAETDLLDARLSLSILLTAEAGRPSGESLDALRLSALFRPRATELDDPPRAWHQRISKALRGYRRIDAMDTGADSPAIATRAQFESAASAIDFVLRVDSALGHPVIVRRNDMVYVGDEPLAALLHEGPYDPDRVRVIAELVLAHGGTPDVPRLRAALDAREHGVAEALSDGWL